MTEEREGEESLLYLRVCEKLAALLAQEPYGPGKRFMTEREVAQRFGVSRTTANKALSTLVVQGALEFRLRQGTFVTGRKQAFDLSTLVSFTDSTERSGKHAETRVLRFERLAARDLAGAISAPGGLDANEVIADLRLAPDDEVFYLERLRLVDDTPAIAEQRCILARACPSLSREHVSGSLFRALTKQLGLHLAGAEQTIEVALLSEDVAHRLGVAGGAPGFRISAVGYHDADAPLWRESTFFRGDLFVLRNFAGDPGRAAAAGVRPVLRSA
jgi:GntR family transcriptional regulator